MKCNSCRKDLPEGMKFCGYCGKAVDVPRPQSRSKRTRGNGQGTVVKTPNGKWKAVVTVGYDVDGKRKTIARTFDKKTDAVNALPSLHSMKPEQRLNERITFGEVFAKVDERLAREITKNNYATYMSAYKYLKPIANMPLVDVKAAHIQECLDKIEGHSMKERAKILAGMVFKWGLQNDIVDRNYATFVDVGKNENKKEREPFTREELRSMFENVGKIPYVEYLIIMCYTGFRPIEFFSLKPEDFHGDYFIGGAKTDAGRNRVVPVPRVILPMVQSFVDNCETTYLFPTQTGKKMAPRNFQITYFPRIMEGLGITRPMTTYSCRHTYATMLKDVTAPLTDKSKLMGHTQFQMTAHYTHTDIDSLRRITDALA